jgi:hypothetical protein
LWLDPERQEPAVGGVKSEIAVLDGGYHSVWMIEEEDVGRVARCGGRKDVRRS